MKRILQFSMSIEFDDENKESSYLIKKLMISIQQATQAMSKTFEDTVLRHQSEFIKCYQIKISELVKIMGQLKGIIEDKFINNTLTIQLQTVLKERDYFKYECLKLNSQLQALLDDHKNISAQASNTAQQLTIYKHLLQSQKIKSNHIQDNLQQLKKNITQITLKNMPPSRNNSQNRSFETDREIIKLKKEIKQKNQAIRAFKERLHDLERNQALLHQQKVVKKQYFDIWRVCVEGWRRQLQNKSKKDDLRLSSWETISFKSKKQLLKMLFTNSQFLKFIQRLLFDDRFKVTIQPTEQKYMQKNRAQLFNFLKKSRIFTSTRGIRL